MSGRYQFAWVLVFQLFQIEPAAFGDLQGFRQQGLRVDPLQGLQGTQVAFPVGEEIGAGLADRQMVADRCHAVLQGSPAAGVHVDVAAGHGR